MLLFESEEYCCCIYKTTKYFCYTPCLAGFAIHPEVCVTAYGYKTHFSSVFVANVSGRLLGGYALLSCEKKYTRQLQPHEYFKSRTHCDITMSFSDIDLGQHLLSNGTGTKQLPESMLTYHQLIFVALSRDEFHGECSSYIKNGFDNQTRTVTFTSLRG